MTTPAVLGSPFFWGSFSEGFIPTVRAGALADGPWMGLKLVESRRGSEPAVGPGLERLFIPVRTSLEADGRRTSRRDFIFEGAGDEAFKPVQREQIKGIDPILRKLDPILFYLKNFQRLKDTPFTIPRGIIFYGRPGGGKSMTACYLASVSGARIVNVRNFPGVRDFFRKDDVKELFVLAEEYVHERGRPIVLFWDEFDTVAFDRNSATDEKKDTITELTARIQGATELPPGVLLIGATNNFDKIDTALKRKGRLGLHLKFSSLELEGRLGLFRHFVSLRPHAGDIDYESLGDLLRSDALAPDIDEVVSEAYRTCRIEHEMEKKPGVLNNDNLSRALIDYLLGQREESFRTPEREFQDAVHEVGHAVVALLLGLDVHLMTILQTSGSGGKTIRHYHKKYAPHATYFASIAADFGGIEAERLMGYPPDVGATDDLRSASRFATDLVHELGRGLVAPGFSYEGILSSREVSTMEEAVLSDPTLREQERDAQIIYEEQRRRAARLLGDFGREALEWMARRLVEKRVILKNELKALLEEARRKFPRQPRLPGVD